MALKTKEVKFRKVVKYSYPDGSIFESGQLAFYLMHILIFFIYVLFSPIHYFFGENVGKKETYWEKIK